IPRSRGAPQSNPSTLRGGLRRQGRSAWSSRLPHRTAPAPAPQPELAPTLRPRPPDCRSGPRRAVPTPARRLLQYSVWVFPCHPPHDRLDNSVANKVLLFMMAAIP
ncbi:mCG1036823, partial [Mus musculus]